MKNEGMALIGSIPSFSIYQACIRIVGFTRGDG